VSYSPEQAYLIPPNVKEGLASDHLCFFVHEVVEGLDLRRFVEAYGEEGGQRYHPSMMLKVGLYAYWLGLTSSRRLEQRIGEELAFRYLGCGPTSGHSTPFGTGTGAGSTMCLCRCWRWRRGWGWRG